MTRIRMSEYHSGLIARHHVFENYPQATTPHTTASLDYLIVALSILLQPFTAHALDLAGAQPIKPHVMVWVASTSSIFDLRLRIGLGNPVSLAVPRRA